MNKTVFYAAVMMMAGSAWSVQPLLAGRRHGAGDSGDYCKAPRMQLQRKAPCKSAPASGGVKKLPRRSVHEALNAPYQKALVTAIMMGEFELSWISTLSPSNAIVKTYQALLAVQEAFATNNPAYKARVIAFKWHMATLHVHFGIDFGLDGRGYLELQACARDILAAH